MTRLWPPASKSEDTLWRRFLESKKPLVRPQKHTFVHGLRAAKEHDEVHFETKYRRLAEEYTRVVAENISLRTQLSGVAVVTSNRVDILKKAC